MRSLHSAEKVKDGIFQAMMEVTLVNDGPGGYESRDRSYESSKQVLNAAMLH